MRRYRGKKRTLKMRNDENPRAKAAKTRAAKKKDWSRKQRMTEQAALKKALGRKNKKRKRSETSPSMGLKIKLQESRNEIAATEVRSNPFSSQPTERRAVKQVKDKLPSTPGRKAQVLAKLITPKTSKVLERRGIINTITCRRKLQMGSALMVSFKQHLNEVKPAGGCSLTRQTACGILRAVVKKDQKV